MMGLKFQRKSSCEPFFDGRIWNFTEKWTSGLPAAAGSNFTGCQTAVTVFVSVGAEKPT